MEPRQANRSNLEQLQIQVCGVLLDGYQCLSSKEEEKEKQNWNRNQKG
jgi:hypothetical protein